jgi:hypothetical protein
MKVLLYTVFKELAIAGVVASEPRVPQYASVTRSWPAAALDGDFTKREQHGLEGSFPQD